MPKLDFLGDKAIVSTDGNGRTRISLHEACIVEFDDDEIVLSTGGLQTQVTLPWMNHVSMRFALGYVILSSADGWVVRTSEDILRFDWQSIRMDRGTGDIEGVVNSRE